MHRIDGWRSREAPVPVTGREVEWLGRGESGLSGIRLGAGGCRALDCLYRRLRRSARKGSRFFSRSRSSDEPSNPEPRPDAVTRSVTRALGSNPTPSALHWKGSWGFVCGIPVGIRGVRRPRGHPLPSRRPVPRPRRHGETRADPVGFYLFHAARRGRSSRRPLHHQKQRVPWESSTS